jgi:hypothetical protein
VWREGGGVQIGGGESGAEPLGLRCGFRWVPMSRARESSRDPIRVDTDTPRGITNAEFVWLSVISAQMAPAAERD